MAPNDKKTYSTASPFEQSFGYSRSVRKGNLIFVSGTTALKLPHEMAENDECTVHFPKDAKLQAQIVMARCVEAVEKLGAGRKDILRVKMFVTHFEDCEAVGAAFRHEFVDTLSESDVGVAATMIVGSHFVDRDILVEVEVDAVCD